MKAKVKEKSNSVKLLDGDVLKQAKVVCIRKNYTIQEYVTEAVKEKNQREK
jgi:hypothetical protein